MQVFETVFYAIAASRKCIPGCSVICVYHRLRDKLYFVFRVNPRHRSHTNTLEFNFFDIHRQSGATVTIVKIHS